MAARKVVLGTRPVSFTRVVEFPMVDGGVGAIDCTFRYRTRKEFGALVDATFAGDTADAFKGGEFSLERQQSLTCEANGAYMHAILVGWNLDQPFSLAACVQLAGEVPAGALAVMEAYRLAITEGRSGN